VAGAAAHVTEPTPLSTEEYQEYAEHYFNVLLGELEKAQEEGSDVEAEYSVCDSISSRSVLTLARLRDEAEYGIT